MITPSVRGDHPAGADTIDQAVRRYLADRHIGTPWLTAGEAADYLRCPLSRVRKLTALRVIPVHREGRRTLYRRDELDAFVLAGGAVAS